MIITCLLIFFILQSFILFCCAAAGNDPLSQCISDKEQIEFLSAWMEHKKEHN